MKVKLTQKVIDDWNIPVSSENILTAVSRYSLSSSRIVVDINGVEWSMLKSDYIIVEGGLDDLPSVSKRQKEFNDARIQTTECETTADYGSVEAAIASAMEQEEKKGWDRISKSTDPLAVQVAGDHYKKMIIQPVEFCQKNKIGFCESSAIKYLCRHRSKNGIEDLKKARHFIDLLIQLEYGE